jgi:hypothetical protein
MTVKFKDRIKSFPKFSRPDGSFTWTDFLTQLVEILEQYRVPFHAWSAWLIDRLSGKAQSALLNLTVAQWRYWPTLGSALNSYFHVEFEMRTAEEELLTRKQGSKESVRDFLNQLMFLARKAYGEDLEKREAAVFKHIELGLASASLRRTFDDLILLLGVTLSMINGELARGGRRAGESCTGCQSYRKQRGSRPGHRHGAGPGSRFGWSRGEVRKETSGGG